MLELQIGFQCLLQEERQQAQQATHLLPQKDEHEWDEHPHDLQPDDCQLDVHGAVGTKHILLIKFMEY